MLLTALIVRPKEWRLLREIPGCLLTRFEEQGWTVKETWLSTPSVGCVLAAARS